MSFARAGSDIKGAFHWIKNPGLKFRKFHVANGTVNRKIFRLVVPDRLDGTVSIQFRTKISRNLRQRGTANRFFFWNGIVISDQNGPSFPNGKRPEFKPQPFHSKIFFYRNGSPPFSQENALCIPQR